MVGKEAGGCAHPFSLALYYEHIMNIMFQF